MRKYSHIIFLLIIFGCKQSQEKNNWKPQLKKETYFKTIRDFDLSKYDSLGNNFYKSKSGEIAELKYTKEYTCYKLNDTCLIYEYLDSIIYIGNEEYKKSLKDFIDVGTYHELPKCYYSIDKKYVYFINTSCHHQNRFLLKNANPKTFANIYKNIWAKDDKYVFYKWWIVKNADPKTFHFIGETGDSAQDKNHIYCNGEILK